MAPDRAQRMGISLLRRAGALDALPAAGPLRPAKVLRARALLADDPARARAALPGSGEDTDLSPLGWWIRLRAAHLLDRPAVVLADAQAALETGKPLRADALLVAVDAAEVVGDLDFRADLMGRLVATGPRGAREADDALAAIVRTASLPGGTYTQADGYLRRFMRTLGGASFDTTTASNTAAAVAILALTESDPQAGSKARAETLGDPARLGVAAQLLALTGDWETLAPTLADAQLTRREPAARVDKNLAATGAHEAAARGALGASVTLAVAAQELGSTGAALERLRIAGTDQLAILAGGVQWPPTEPVPHTQEPHSILNVLGQSLPHRSGGYATRSHGLLTGLGARGWDVAAATKLGFPLDFWRTGDPSEVAATDTVDGVTYHRALLPGVSEYPRYPLAEHVGASADAITPIAQRRHAALIHAASLFDVGMAGATVARRLGVPFVYEMRGLKQLLEGARFPGYEDSQAGAFLDLVETQVAKAADRVLVITSALGELMVSSGIDADRITVVPNGVHTAEFAPSERDQDLARRLGIAPDVTVIGYVGGMVHYEGLELLLDAADELRRRGREFVVLIVGDGAHAPMLRRHAGSLGLGPERLLMPGRVPHSEVERYLSLIDIAPFPRVPMPVSELISPIKPFEAMATSKAVVVSDVAALTEIVTDGATGRTFTKGDAASLADVLDELLADDAQRERLGTAAREWVVANRDWSAIADIVSAVYSEILGVDPADSTRA